MIVDHRPRSIERLLLEENSDLQHWHVSTFRQISLILCVFAIWPNYQLVAQLPCEYGSAKIILDNGQSRATVSNNGRLFWPGAFEDPDIWFEAPKGSGINAFFTAQVSMVGYVNGEFRRTGRTYGSSYYPGPLTESGYPSKNCSDYNRIYSVRRDEFLTGSVTQDIADWPYDHGAPVVDGNRNVDDYSVSEGDKPALVGEHSAWWVMNDGGRSDSADVFGVHQLGLQTDVFAATLATPNDVNVLLFRYRFKYVGENRVDSAYVGLMTTPDLGDSENNRLGSDTLANTVYAYHDDVVDRFYGNRQPAVAVVLLNGPYADKDKIDNDRDGEIDEEGERLGMTSFVADNDVDEWHSEVSYSHFKGQCLFSGPIRTSPNRSGCGVMEGKITTYFFPGDPIAQTGWYDTAYYSYRKILIASGPFTLEPGDEQGFEFAMLYARGNSRFESLKWVLSLAQHVNEDRSLFEPDIPEFTPTVLTPDIAGFEHIYPNPADNNAQIEYTVPETTPVRIVLYDMLGRLVLELYDGVRQPGWYSQEVSLDGLPSGAYIYKIIVGRLVATRLLTVIH